MVSRRGQEDPYRPGHRAGDFTFNSRNIGGLRLGLQNVILGGRDVYCVQECKAAEMDIADITDAASNAGYWACWGLTTRISSGPKTTQGRQVVSLVNHRASTKPTDVSPDDDDDVALLCKTGRWMDRLIAVGDDGAHIIVAVLYCYCGASYFKLQFCESCKSGMYHISSRWMRT